MVKPNWKETLKLWSFGFLKVPMIGWVRPLVLSLTDQDIEIKIPMKRRMKNHLDSMYFGALCVGADVAGGIHLMHIVKGDLKKISFVFKDFHADFLKRPEADVHFKSHDGNLIASTVQKALQTRVRENVKVHVIATTPSLSNDEPVARFSLTLSVKIRN